MKMFTKLAGVAGLMTTLSAHAGFILDTSNVGPVAGQASAIPTNNDLAPILNAHGFSVSSYFVGAKLLSDVGGTVSYEYLGKEAGYTNTFDIYSGTKVLFSTAGLANSVWNPSTFSTPSTVNAGGYVDFTFCTNANGGAGAGCVSNASNGYFTGKVAASKSIAITLLDPFTALLWWDDGGGTPSDADHDDMVVLAKLNVPEPGTSALFGLGLLAMGFTLRNRRKNGNGPQTPSGYNLVTG